MDSPEIDGLAPGPVLTAEGCALPVAGAASPTEVIGENPASWQSDVTFTHSLALVLDEDGQRRVDAIRTRLRRAGVPVLGFPGHITLCCVDSMAGVDAAVHHLGMPRRLRLPFTRVLPGASGVVALCLDPDRPTSRCEEVLHSDGADPRSPGAESGADPWLRRAARLRDAHRRLHERLAALGTTTFNFYAPPAWAPHISIGFHVEDARLPDAVRIVSGFGPVEVGLAGISVWTIGTDEQRLLLRF